MSILGRIKKIFRKLQGKGFVLADYIGKVSEYEFGPYGRSASPLERLTMLSVNDSYSFNSISDSHTPTRIAIFAAYSNKLTASTKVYLQTLKKAGFAVVYINNSRTSKSEIPSILKLTWQAFDRVNIGRDIGAFKDGVLLLQSEGHIGKCELLGIFNDSVTFIPGSNADELVRRINSFAASHYMGLFSHLSNDVLPHYQSFFQVLKPEIFRSAQFLNFWKKYHHISHRGHSIYNGEVALSTKVYSCFSPNEILYSSISLAEQMQELKIAGSEILYQDLIDLLPSTSKTIEAALVGNSLRNLIDSINTRKKISTLTIYCIAELIESSNPSHMAAFLYPIFLRCPLVKNDICSAGTYSLAQASSLVRKVLEYSADTIYTRNQASVILEEFKQLIVSKGTPRSYANKPRDAAIKGITSGFVYPKAFDL
jgi:hypothetical protein